MEISIKFNIFTQIIMSSLMIVAGALPMGRIVQSDAGANYPNNPITLVVPYPAGGVNDVMGV